MQRRKNSNRKTGLVRRLIIKLIKVNVLRLGSASDDLPSLLLGLVANARPAVLLVGHEILSALDIGDDVGSASLEGGSAGLDCPLNVDCALHGQGFRTLVSADRQLLVSEIRDWGTLHGRSAALRRRTGWR